MIADESKEIGARNISTVIATRTDDPSVQLSAAIGVASAAIGVPPG